MTKLAIIVPLTIELIFILITPYSFTSTTLIIAHVPFSTIGGVRGLFLTGQYLSGPSASGFIAEFGVAMLNGIALVTTTSANWAYPFATRCGKKRPCACFQC